jgi:diguanylate cyclase (GGDEF)-like protein
MDSADGSDLVFLLLDLDHFKSVNDTYGHAAGDAVLVQTAAVLSRVFRASDPVVRWGGEEFLAVARFVDRREAPRLAEKIRAAIAGHPFRLDDGTVLQRTCSVGFAAFPFTPSQPRSIPWEEVVGLADFGLYAAKKSGRNRWVGIEAGEAEDPQETLRRFRADPEASLAGREMRMIGMEAPVEAWKTTPETR